MVKRCCERGGKNTTFERDNSYVLGSCEKLDGAHPVNQYFSLNSSVKPEKNHQVRKPEIFHFGILTREGKFCYCGLPRRM